jgi:hypothetical protein
MRRTVAGKARAIHRPGNKSLSRTAKQECRGSGSNREEWERRRKSRPLPCQPAAASLNIACGRCAGIEPGRSRGRGSCRARRDVPDSLRRLGQQVLGQTAVRRLRGRAVTRRPAWAAVARKPNQSMAASCSPRQAPPTRSLLWPSSSPGPKSRRFGNNAEGSGKMDHEIPPEF